MKFKKFYVQIFFLCELYLHVDAQWYGYSATRYRYSTYVARWAYEDQTSRFDKYKVKRLAKELLVESLFKMAQTEGIIDRCNKNMPFNVGVIMGLIRDKYQKMFTIYRTLLDKISGRSLMYPPAYEIEEWMESSYYSYPSKKLRNLHMLIHMEYVHTMYLEIAGLVDVLLKLPQKFFVPVGIGLKVRELKSLGHPLLDALQARDPVEQIELEKLLAFEMGRTTRKPVFTPTFTPAPVFTTTEVPGYIRGPHGPPPPTRFQREHRRMEEELKGQMRQKYLMRRLGYPQDYVTKMKRFQQQWPVEGTWSFENVKK